MLRLKGSTRMQASRCSTINWWMSGTKDAMNHLKIDLLLYRGRYVYGMSLTIVDRQAGYLVPQSVRLSHTPE
jgi:hypothetical protein